jgi:NAD-dependent dihydropyrimidine dehydrogenase PreA subunit
MLLKLTGKVTRAYASERSGNLYLTLADADTLTQLKVVSERVGIDEVRPHLDELCVIECQVKASTFVSREQGERQDLEVLAIRFGTVAAASPETQKLPNGAKVPA